MNARMPPLVAHVIYRLDFGGLENGLVNLINHMPADRLRHVVICLAGYSEFRRRIQRDDVAVLSIDKKPGKDLAAYWRMWRTLRQLRPAIVHTRNLGTVDMQWVACVAGVPNRVHGEHGWEASDPDGSNARHLAIRRACAPVIHQYVAVSRDIARWLQQRVGVSPQQLVQIYNGVDFSRFTRDGSRPPDLPWSGPGVTLGAVGRLDPIKNHRALVRAFHELLHTATGRTSNLRLIIVGDGPLRNDLSAEIERLGLDGRVWLTGARNDVPALMRCMDVFVLPSLNEGISNTLLEAMAMGLPAVAARVGGNPELIVNGVTGTIYDGSDSAGLAGALLPLLQGPSLREQLGAAAAHRAREHFALQSMVDRYQALYDALPGGK